MPLTIQSLSPATQTAILAEAENFDHNLLFQFEFLAKECSSESEYILKAKSLIHGMLTYDEDEIDELFIDEERSKTEFHEVLNRILKNIEQL
jgi:hypothetical protein